jgi:sugar O-acyltransferase (sialic acid O-acetyltransferase NeuD family)
MVSGGPACVLLGGGGHAAVVADMLLLSGYTLAGFLAPQARGLLQTGGAWPWLGADDTLSTLDPRQVVLANGMGNRPRRNDNGLGHRQRAYLAACALGFAFPPLQHPSATVARGTVVAPGSQIMAGAVLQVGTEIGENSLVNTRASIDHHCRIGAHVHVGPGAVLCGQVEIGAGVHVGAGAVLLPGISVGEGAVIAAGAVVRHAVAAGAFAS